MSHVGTNHIIVNYAVDSLDLSYLYFFQFRYSDGRILRAHKISKPVSGSLQSVSMGLQRVDESTGIPFILNLAFTVSDKGYEARMDLKQTSPYSYSLVDY